jgi:hypothetical protein
MPDLRVLMDELVEFNMASAQRSELLATRCGTVPVLPNSAFQLSTIAATVLQMIGGGFDEDEHDDNCVFFTTSTEIMAPCFICKTYSHVPKDMTIYRNSGTGQALHQISESATMSIRMAGTASRLRALRSSHIAFFVTTVGVSDGFFASEGPAHIFLQDCDNAHISLGGTTLSK